jgi:hypothetical protein
MVTGLSRCIVHKAHAHSVCAMNIAVFIDSFSKSAAFDTAMCTRTFSACYYYVSKLPGPCRAELKQTHLESAQLMCSTLLLPLFE